MSVSHLVSTVYLASVTVPRARIITSLRIFVSRRSNRLWRRHLMRSGLKSHPTRKANKEFRQLAKYSTSRAEVKSGRPIKLPKMWMAKQLVTSNMPRGVPARSLPVSRSTANVFSQVSCAEAIASVSTARTMRAPLRGVPSWKIRLSLSTA